MMKMIACGDSMLPTLKDGQKYRLKKIHNKDIFVGDIVVYKIGDIYICHRIINVIKSSNGSVFYKLQGDNCDKPDSYAVTRDMIIGKVIL